MAREGFASSVNLAIMCLSRSSYILFFKKTQTFHQCDQDIEPQKERDQGQKAPT